MDEAEGLRERKKAATRLALHEAALRLAAQDGLDHVTVEAIADEANVSRRTFSNYFSSKEEALFHDDSVRLRRMLELVRVQPPQQPVWTVLGQAVEELIAEDHEQLDPTWLDRRRRLRSSPGLIAHQVAAYAALERDLATEVARRLEGADVDLRSRIVAATFLATMRVATQQWIDHQRGTLQGTIRKALRLAVPHPPAAGVPAPDAERAG